MVSHTRPPTKLETQERRHVTAMPEIILEKQRLRLRSIKAVFVAAVLLAALAAACSSSDGDDGQVGAAADAEGDARSTEVYKLAQQVDLSIDLTSSKFNETRRIPRTSSCEREDVSPPITWGDVPEGTVSLALLVDSDQFVREKFPDLLWVHWVLWNIPPDARGLPEAVPKTPSLPSIGPQAGQGTNDETNVGWSGPCKPAFRVGWTVRATQSERRQLVSKYHFRLYALDAQIELGPEASKNDLLRAIEGHVLAGGELVGEFVPQVKRVE
jgi:Raf kinase inhibitor-like YbhB/YbcL family protein